MREKENAMIALSMAYAQEQKKIIAGDDVKGTKLQHSSGAGMQADKDQNLRGRGTNSRKWVIRQLISTTSKEQYGGRSY